MNLLVTYELGALDVKNHKVHELKDNFKETLWLVRLSICHKHHEKTLLEGVLQTFPDGFGIPSKQIFIENCI
jgi:hypothetical protein